MLHNKDFATIIKSGGGGGTGNQSNDASNKVRFDLKQISKWEKENEKITKKKQIKFASFNEKSTKEVADKSGYRDRAFERRRELTKEEQKMEEIISKLDREQTKLLGGDIEHTHLVKGLDYALLEKIRRESMMAKDEVQVNEAKVNDTIEDTKNDVSVLTPMGLKIKSLLFPTAAIESKKHRIETKEKIILRTFYEFDINPLSDQEVPLTVSKSEKDRYQMDNYVNYIMDNSLLERISSLFEDGKLQSKLKKKRKIIEDSISSINGVSSTTLTSIINQIVSQETKPTKSYVDSIYDDEILPSTSSIDNKKYIPSGQLSTIITDHPMLGGKPLVSIQSLMKPEQGDPSTEQSNEVKHQNPDSNEEAAPTHKKKRQPEKMGSRAQIPLAEMTHEKPHTIVKGDLKVEKDSTGKSLIHRDVFATTDVDHVVQAKETAGIIGEQFGLHGTYDDLYPEKIEGFEIADSDEDPSDDEDGKRSKKTAKIMKTVDGSPSPKAQSGSSRSQMKGQEDRPSSRTPFISQYSNLEGSIKKSILKPVTPWSRSHGLSSSNITNDHPGNRTMKRPVLKAGQEISKYGK